MVEADAIVPCPLANTNTYCVFNHQEAGMLEHKKTETRLITLKSLLEVGDNKSHPFNVMNILHVLSCI